MKSLKLLIILGLALGVVSSLPFYLHAGENQGVTPLCVMEISTDQLVYHPDERVQLHMWLKLNKDPDLPNIKNARFKLELTQPLGTTVTLTTKSDISLRKGAEWDEALLPLPIAGEPFRNMGRYQVHAILLSQTGEIYCEAYTNFTIRSIFGRDSLTRTLLITSRRTEFTEPFVSRLAVWLEAAYRTRVQVICQEGIYESYKSGLYRDFDVIIYYATDYEQSPPSDMIVDIFEGEGITKKKVVWIGYHLDKVQAYLHLYGLSYGALSTGNAPSKLLYLNSGVSYNLSSPDRTSVEVINDDLARVQATVEDVPIIISAQQTYHPEDGECFYQT